MASNQFYPAILARLRKPNPFDVHTKYFACIITVFEHANCEHIPMPVETDFDLFGYICEPVEMGEPTDLIFDGYPILLS